MEARSEDEVYEEIDRAMQSRQEHGTQWAGMSYEDGVDSALRWAIGETDEKPMDG